jgi:hypothetical protein
MSLRRRLACLEQRCLKPGILEGSDWVYVRAKMFERLRSYPEALLALKLALEEIELSPQRPLDYAGLKEAIMETMWGFPKARIEVLYCLSDLALLRGELSSEEVSDDEILETARWAYEELSGEKAPDFSNRAAPAYE